MSSLGRDFQRLWFAYGVSELGSYVAYGALPLIAVLVLGSPAWQVALLAAVGTLTSAVFALPLGPWIEFRRKRPVMIGADVARALALLSVPVVYALGELSFAQLCVVAAVQALGQIAFTAASGAHLKALVPAGERVRALGRLEATTWSAVTVGPMLGGLLISGVGKTVTIALDALSYLVSAVGIGRLRTPEPAPPVAERLAVTADDHMARVHVAWSIASKTMQPVCMVAGGVLAGLTSVRIGLWAAAILVLLSVFLLPWRSSVDRVKVALIPA